MTPASPTWITLREGHGDDAVALAALINRAYVVEAPFIRGERTSAGGVAAALETGTLLVAEDEQQRLLGCVHVTVRGGEGSFGLLSVEPRAQRSGLGRRLVRSAEAWLAGHGCERITIQVVSGRSELVPWYEGLGYRVAGTEPFVQPERLKEPVHFIVMTRELAAGAS